MKLRIIFIVLCQLTIMSLYACDTKGVSKTLEKQEKMEEIQSVEESIYDPGEPDWSFDEYQNPYEYNSEEVDTPKAEMYWTLQRNSIAIISRVSHELANKNWDNISSQYGYPSEYLRNGVFLTKKEREQFLCLVEGMVNCPRGEINVLVIIALSEDCPHGRISRVIYTPGREWYPDNENEIVDAYTIGLWETALSY